MFKVVRDLEREAGPEAAKREVDKSASAEPVKSAAAEREANKSTAGKREADGKCKSKPKSAAAPASAPAPAPAPRRSERKRKPALSEDDDFVEPGAGKSKQGKPKRANAGNAEPSRTKKYVSALRAGEPLE